MVTLRTLAERRSEILGLAERYRAGDVRVFGSVVRGNNRNDSDVDFLIKPGQGVRYSISEGCWRICRTCSAAGWTW